MKGLSFNFAGAFSNIDAENRNLYLAIGQGGSLDQGCLVKLYLLVDPKDGVIIDACYQSYSDLTVVETMEVLCAFCLKKTYVQVSHITSDILQKEVKKQISNINICLEALDEAVDHCLHIEPTDLLQTPVSFQEDESSVIEGFSKFSKKKKKAIIEEVLNEKIRPYIEMDAGGLQIIDIKDNELLVEYTGTCTSCPSSIGGTLQSIEKILNLNVDPNLIVRPVFAEGEGPQVLSF